MGGLRVFWLIEIFKQIMQLLNQSYWQTNLAKIKFITHVPHKCELRLKFILQGHKKVVIFKKLTRNFWIWTKSSAIKTSKQINFLSLTMEISKIFLIIKFKVRSTQQAQQLKIGLWALDAIFVSENSSKVLRRKPC